MGPGCTEPGADSTLKLIAQLEASGKAAGNGQVDANVVRLAERAQMLSFLRESLYRSCERLAAGQTAAGFQLVVPRIAGPALTLSSGGLLAPAAALLTLDDAGLRLDSLLPTPAVPAD